MTLFPPLHTYRFVFRFPSETQRRVMEIEARTLQAARAELKRRTAPYQVEIVMMSTVRK
jgi:hypothetical protein